MESIRSKIDEAGRVLIPLDFQDMLHLKAGQDISISMRDGELRIRSFDGAIQNARELVKKYNKENKDLVALLFQDRHDDLSRS